MRPHQWKSILAAIALLIAAFVYSRGRSQSSTQAPPVVASPVEHKNYTKDPAPTIRSKTSRAETTASVAPQPLSSFKDVNQARQSNVWMTATVRVVKLLPDDTKGDKHQRFLVVGRHAHSILIAHNIDIAKKIPIRVGDSLELRGRYEWNDKGGVLHWTHHDPSGRKQGGWIRHNGQLYK